MLSCVVNQSHETRVLWDNFKIKSLRVLSIHIGLIVHIGLIGLLGLRSPLALIH